jgi:O-antigen ligase
LDTLGNPTESFSGRSSRWSFAMDLLDDASTGQLLFGEGFDYLSRYAVEFHNATPEDYPHNPIISAAIFSGVIGCIPVLLLIVLASAQYIKRSRTDLYFAALFLASMFFVIPSYNSIFSGKLFGILLLIPWSLPELTHYKSNVTSHIYSPEYL